MIARSEAEQLVQKELAESGATKLDVVITEIRDLDWGWVFFYNTRTFAETKNFRDGLAGNAPYLVDARTGAVVVTGTAFPIDEYIKNYERDNGY